MYRVFKYKLESTLDPQIIAMPLNAEILTADIQDTEGELTPCIWAIVDDEAVLETRQIIIIATGNKLPDNDLKYLATIQRDSIVVHVFEVLPEKG